MAKETARAILLEMEQAINDARDEGADDERIKAIRSEYLAHYKKAASANGVRDTLKMAQSEAGVKSKADELDTHPMLLNAWNGTVDLQTGQRA
jgi:phage/plasmid-associated DNA primase